MESDLQLVTRGWKGHFESPGMRKRFSMAFGVRFVSSFVFLKIYISLPKTNMEAEN